MQIEPHITLKEFKKVKPGELIVRRWQTRDTLMIVVEKDAVYTVLAALRPPEADDNRPVYMKVQHEGVCASYGSDWAIQLIGRPTFNNSKTKDVPGVISFSAEGEAILVLGAYDHSAGFDEIGFDLHKNSITHLPRECCSVTSWAIWSSRASMSDPRQEPIYRFEHR